MVIFSRSHFMNWIYLIHLFMQLHRQQQLVWVEIRVTAFILWVTWILEIACRSAANIWLLSKGLYPNTNRFAHSVEYLQKFILNEKRFWNLKYQSFERFRLLNDLLWIHKDTYCLLNVTELYISEDRCFVNEISFPQYRHPRVLNGIDQLPHCHFNLPRSTKIIPEKFYGTENILQFCQKTSLLTRTSSPPPRRVSQDT